MIKKSIVDSFRGFYLAALRLCVKRTISRKGAKTQRYLELKLSFRLTLAITFIFFKVVILHHFHYGDFYEKDRVSFCIPFYNFISDKCTVVEPS
jgi:hypothetical protein